MVASCLLVKITHGNLEYEHQPRIGLEENGPELFIGQLSLQLVDSVEKVDQLHQRPGIVHQEVGQRIVVQLPADIKYPGSTRWSPFM